MFVTNIITGHDLEGGQKLLYSQMDEAEGVDNHPILSRELHLAQRQL